MGALLLIVVVVIAVATLASFVSVAEQNANNRASLLTNLKNENLQLEYAQFSAVASMVITGNTMTTITTSPFNTAPTPTGGDTYTVTIMGTTTGGTTDSVLTTSGTPYTPGALAGDMLTYTSGPAIDVSKPIISNTANMITTNAFNPAPSASGGDTYTVTIASGKTTSATATVLTDTTANFPTNGFVGDTLTYTNGPATTDSPWSSVELSIRNSNTANSGVSQIKAGNYWFQWKQVDSTTGNATGPLFGFGGVYMPIPAKGTLNVKLDFGVGGHVEPARDASITITLLTVAGNFFTTVYNSPTADGQVGVSTINDQYFNRDVVSMDGTQSQGANGSQIVSYIWTVDVEHSSAGCTVANLGTAEDYVPVTVSGTVAKFLPEAFQSSTLNPLSNFCLTGPFAVSLEVIDSAGFIGYTDPITVGADPNMAPPASLTLVSNTITVNGMATVTVEMTDIFGNPMTGQVVDFAVASGNISSVNPLFATTNSMGEASTSVAFGEHGGVIIAVSEANSALKLQVAEGGALEVSISPANPTVDNGQSITLTAIPSGGSGTYTTYSWYQGSCTGKPVQSGASASYATGALSATTNFCVQVTDSENEMATATTTVTVSSSSLTANPIMPSSPSIDPGQSITLQANPSGGTTPYSYQWYTGASCTAPIAGATGSTYLASPSSTTTYYYMVTDPSMGTACSAGDTVTVNTSMTPPIISAPYPGMDSGQSETISTTASFSGGSSPYTCQWLQEAPGAGSFSNLGGSFGCTAGATPSVSTGTLTTTGVWSFELKVTDSVLTSVTSSPATVTVNPTLLVPTPTPSSQNVDQGQTATVRDSAPVMGTPAYTYQWLEEAPGSTSYTPATDCSAPTTTLTCTFVTSGVTGTTTTGTTSTVMTNAGATYTANAFVGALLTYTSGPAADETEVITSNTATTITTAAFSPAPTPTGGDTYEVTLSGTYNFELQATDSSVTPETATSAPVTVSVNPVLVAAVISASPTSISPESSSTLTTTTPFTGGISTYSCQWLQEGPGATGYSAMGSSFLCSPSDTYVVTTGPLSAAGNWNFEFVVTDSANPAVTATSNAVTVTVT